MTLISDFLKSTFMWWKSSRLVADDVINEQISLNLELRLEHLVHSYGIWHSPAHITSAPITANFISYFIFGLLYLSQISARFKSYTDKVAQ